MVDNYYPDEEKTTTTGGKMMSKKVLFIKGTPLPAGISRSMEVANAFIVAYQKQNPNDEIIERDLFSGEVPYIDGDVLSGWGKFANNEALTETETRKVTAFNVFTEEFLAADKVIVQSSMWNLSVAPQVKGWLDTINVAGKTFNYTEAGPVGLVTDKKAIHIHGAGGIYSTTAGSQHSDALVTDILKFIGTDVLPTIWVEGLDYNPEAKEETMQKIIATAETVARQF